MQREYLTWRAHPGRPTPRGVDAPLDNLITKEGRSQEKLDGFGLKVMVRGGGAEAFGLDHTPGIHAVLYFLSQSDLNEQSHVTVTVGCRSAALRL